MFRKKLKKKRFKKKRNENIESVDPVLSLFSQRSTILVFQVTRQRLAKTIEAATQRNKASFEPHPESKPTHERVRRTRRRVMLGNAVDAVTGEVVGSPQKRKSRRKSTVLNTQQMHSRLKDAEIKRVSNMIELFL